MIAAEDQKFAAHSGFDVDAIVRAVEEKRRKPRGASTISQQLAKNLYLWPGRSFVRKGLEAYFTVWLEQTWPKRRILEVYLNVAEFGPGIFGAAAASEVMFGKPPSDLTLSEAALLAAVLPNPKRMSATHPSRVRHRARGPDRAGRAPSRACASSREFEVHDDAEISHVDRGGARRRGARSGPPRSRARRAPPISPRRSRRGSPRSPTTCATPSTIAFDDEERFDLRLAPIGLEGLRRDAMSDAQWQAWLGVLGTTLSMRGLQKVEAIMANEREVRARDRETWLGTLVRRLRPRRGALFRVGVRRSGRRGRRGACASTVTTSRSTGPFRARAASR